MLVDIDFILMAKKRFAQINAENLENITWVKDGKDVTFSDEDLESFKFMGLVNIDLPEFFPLEQDDK